MPLMLRRTYEALIAAGAPEEQASAAAEEIAAYERRLAGIETDVAELRGDMRLLKWMVGGLYAVLTVLGLPGVWLLVRVAAKVGALG